jgi:hypothetical protein
MKDGIRVSNDRDYLPEVIRAKPGGNFLMEDGTLDACHNGEFTMPELADRNTFER